MEENKFEKQVRQKLDELKMNPSDDAWQNIQKRIVKKEPQRRRILILIFLFLFILTGGYWLLNSEKNIKIQNNQFIRIIKNDSEKVTNKKKDSSSIQSIISVKKNTGIVGYKIPEIVSSSNTNMAKNKNPKRLGFFKGSLIKTQIKNIISSKEETDKIQSFEEGANKKIKRNIFPDEKKEVAKNDGVLNIEFEKFSHKKIDEDSMKNIAGSKKIIEKIDSAILDKRLGKPFVKNQKNKWELGITFSGGSSLVVDDPLGINNNTDYFSSPSNSGGSGSSNSGGSGSSPNSPSSKTRNSIAFIAGVFMEKNMSPEHKIFFGINYKYFSTSNKVGSKIDSAVTSYRAANSVINHRNNLNYLELPVSLKLKLSNNKSLPVYGQFGISISQIISSNALQYKYNPGLYYIDNSLFNKTQLGFSTGLSMTLFSKQKNPINIGPYFYYSASRLANQGLYNKKHFSFIGISTEILFLKK